MKTTIISILILLGIFGPGILGWVSTFTESAEVASASILGSMILCFFWGSACGEKGFTENYEPLWAFCLTFLAFFAICIEGYFQAIDVCTGAFPHGSTAQIFFGFTAAVSCSGIPWAIGWLFGKAKNHNIEHADLI